MKIPVTLRDPQTIGKFHVDAILASDERWSSTASTTLLPASRPGAERSLAVTRLDGWDTVQWPVTGRARLRIVAFDDNDDTAWDLASFILGSLLARPGDADTAGYLFNSAPTRDLDPDFNSPISAFTIIQKVKPQIIETTPSITNA